MKFFLASSAEAIEILHEVASWIEDLGHEAMTWDKPTLFLPGDNTFSKLIQISKEVDGAIFVFSEDDQVWYRTDSLAQPRDNVLIEYGLFAGALGTRRAIVIRLGKPKTATDLLGLVVVNMLTNKKQGARLRINAWAQNLESQKEDPAVLDLIMERDAIRRELDSTKEQLHFEQAKARDLEELLSKQEFHDFSSYDFSGDGHWKLLFDHGYYRNVLSLLVKEFPSLEEWHSEVVRCGIQHELDRIRWGSFQDPSRPTWYIGKSLRVLRKFCSPSVYSRFLTKTRPSIRQAVDALGQHRARYLNGHIEQE